MSSQPGRTDNRRWVSLGMVFGGHSCDIPSPFGAPQSGKGLAPEWDPAAQLDEALWEAGPGRIRPGRGLSRRTRPPMAARLPRMRHTVEGEPHLPARRHAVRLRIRGLALKPGGQQPAPPVTPHNGMPLDGRTPQARTTGEEDL